MMRRKLQFKVGQDSHTGLVRQENQDALGWFSTQEGELFMVADGMGGSAGGKTAADISINGLRCRFEQSVTNHFETLRLGIEEANQQVLERAAQEPELDKMGSTIVAMIYSGELAYIAHVGDSRIYLIRRGHISRLTKDHSKVQKLIDTGKLSELEAEKHPDSHVITRCIGGSTTLEVDIRSNPIICQPGDVFLLCSDGLSSLVADQEMERIISGSSGSPSDTCQELVQLALDRGGHDNVTVQLICFSGRAEELELTSAKHLLHENGTDIGKQGKNAALGFAKKREGFHLSKFQLLMIGIAAVVLTLLFITGLLLKNAPEPLPKERPVETSTNVGSPDRIEKDEVSPITETVAEDSLRPGMAVEVEILADLSRGIKEKTTSAIELPASKVTRPEKKKNKQKEQGNE